MKRILLMRPDNREDKAFFEARDYEVMELPLVRYELLALSPEALAELKTSDWLVFTSQRPVESILAHLEPGELKISAVGQKTAEKIESLGFAVDFMPSIATKASFISEWPAPGQKIFYPKSNLADDSLARTLGAKEVVCYEHQEDVANLELLENLINFMALDSVYFTSPSSWQRFYKIYQKHPFPIDIIAIGETTKKAIQADLSVDVLEKEKI
ncbi:uroporphyrinogen-III synthase [Lactococcus termiticola]|uniref:Uroporphyrinogen-III synthase n=1 Tax=Lactococcus termiticola TaxID=2169526 RepID=A0A2R5HF47_9LACT|nr:uroporphyrinogen-III synthase [Lactococcus termiticola]GBG96689.1 hypothetical protein NtB2_00813 [Lactococcus termiticola]